MKIRTGFVSNSSSSSFLVMGVVFTKELFPDLFCDPKALRVISETLGYGWWHNGLDDYCDELILGLDMCEIQENETLAAFRKRVFEALKTIGYTGTLEQLIMIRDQGRD